MFKSLKSLKSSRKGFTLIELLVVIAIIGILSSVVLASLSTAREKSRDAKRISDIGQIQLALELFFDASQSYPSTTPGCQGAGNPVCTTSATLEAAVSALTSAGFLPQSPVPPPGATPALYLYRGILSTDAECIAAGSSCTNYWLGVVLERDDNTVLDADADVDLTADLGAYAAAPRAAGAAGGEFIGNDSDCLTAAVVTPDKCYDVKP